MMNDAQIDALIERVKPDLKIAIKDLLSGKAVHIFNFAEGTNSSTGVRSKIVIFLAQEAPAAVLEGTVNGLDEAGNLLMKQLQSCA